MDNQIFLYYYSFKDIEEDFSISNRRPLIASLQKEAERYRFIADRNRFITGRLLIRHALSQHGFEDVTLSDILYSDCLKPRFDFPFYFNLSHSGKYIILAVSLNNDVGCDIEFHNPNLDFSEFSSFFTDEELSLISTSPLPVKSFFDLWTIKESLLKADGRGMHFPPKSIRLQNNYGMLDNEKIYFRITEIAEQYSTSIACTENFDTIKFIEVTNLI